MRPDEEIERELAKLDDAAERGGLSGMRNGPVPWIAGAILAVGAAALIVTILELNKPDITKRPPPKPVTVQIVPR